MNSLELPIVWQNDDFLVIDKPAGLLTHPTEKGSEPSVVDFARNHTNDDDPVRPGIVHRLDRETSGLLVIAKTTEAKAYLQEQFRERKVKKTYLALVRGRLKNDEAVIRLPIGHSGRSVRQEVSATGQPAETWYKVLAEYPGMSLIEVRPLTGRTHQIRVHFAKLGHPVIGDAIYGQPDPKLSRHFLHAHKLELTLKNGEQKEFVSELPAELKNYLEKLTNSV